MVHGHDHVDSAPREPRVPARRGLAGFALFAFGSVLAHDWPWIPSSLWLGAAAALLAIAVLRAQRIGAAALAMSMVLLGAGWLALRVHERAGADLSGFLDPSQLIAPVELRGMVSEVALAPSHSGGLSFSLSLSGFSTPSGWRACSGVVKAHVGGPPQPSMRAGDRIVARGYFTPVSGPRNPGEIDPRWRASQDGVVGRLSVESAELIRPDTSEPTLGERACGLWWGLLHRLRAGAGRGLDASMSREVEEAGLASSAGPDRAGEALLGALLLGRADPALRPLTGAMSRLGQVHVLSISGFHLAVMAALALFVVRLTGDRGRLEPLIVGGLVVLYLLIVPAESPVLRSGLMVLGLLAGEAIGRRYDRLNLLGWIGVALLLWRPMDLWSAGFQLSFGVTATLLWLGERVHERWFPPPIYGQASEVEAARDPGMRSIPRMLWSWCTGLFSSSVLCWAVATPTVMLHVGIVSPFAAFTSVLLAPLFTLLLWLGYPLLVLGAAWPGGAALLGGVLRALGDASVRLTLWLDGAPGMAVSTPAVSTAWTVCATAVILAWFRWGRRDDARLWWGSAIVLAWLVWTLAAAGRVSPSVALRIDALSVGDGSAVLLRSGDQAVLWGGGSRSRGAIRSVVARAARALGAWRVRTLVIPGGPYEDFGEAPEAALALGVRDALVPQAMLVMAEQDRAGAAASVLERLRAAGVRIRGLRGGELLRFGSALLALHGVGGDENAEGGIPPVLLGELTVPPPAQGPEAAPEAPILLMGHLARRSLEREVSSGRWPAARAIELPRGQTSEPIVRWTMGVGPEVIWRSEAPRLADLSTRADRLEASSSAFSTAYNGALWLELSQDGVLRAGVRAAPDGAAIPSAKSR